MTGRIKPTVSNPNKCGGW